MYPAEQNDWYPPGRDSRIDLLRLFPRVPGAQRTVSIAETVIERATDEATADALEALAERLPEARPARRRRLSVRAAMKLVGISAVLAFVVLAVRWELTKGGKQDGGWEDD